MKNLIFFIFLFFFMLAAAGCGVRTNETSDQAGTSNRLAEKDAGPGRTVNDYPVSSADNLADKLEVYYFHGTARCYSCKTIGQYVKETMEQQYAEQIKNGQIDYREINIDLPENKEVARKYQAIGSSLFINRIKGGQDNIEPDMNVWKLLGDEARFKSYLEDKINSHLGI